MDIRTALARIKTVEEGLSITTPEAVAVKHVYTYFPHQSAAIEAPCFMHDFALLSVDHYPGGLRKRVYLVRIQFWSDNADKDRAADICAAFEQKWVDAFSDDITLNGACTGPIKFRGESPTLVTHGERGWIGLALEMEIPMNEAATVGP